jgi:hypothetical protein
VVPAATREWVANLRVPVVVLKAAAWDLAEQVQALLQVVATPVAVAALAPALALEIPAVVEAIEVLADHPARATCKLYDQLILIQFGQHR